MALKSKQPTSEEEAAALAVMSADERSLAAMSAKDRSLALEAMSVEDQAVAVGCNHHWISSLTFGLLLTGDNERSLAALGLLSWRSSDNLATPDHPAVYSHELYESTPAATALREITLDSRTRAPKTIGLSGTRHKSNRWVTAPKGDSGWGEVTEWCT